MATTTAPLLGMVRRVMQERGLTVPALAEKSKIDRGRLRRALTDQEPITLADFLSIAEVLELQPATLANAPELAEEAETAPVEVPKLAAVKRFGRAPEPEALTIDPWGVHATQVLQVGFALACDILFMVRIDALGASGVPAAVLAPYKNGVLPIRLDAAYHKYYRPRYDDGGVTLTLSFDALYECRFPYPAFVQITIFPLPPAPEDEPAPAPEGRPTLRVVK